MSEQPLAKREPQAVSTHVLTKQDIETLFAVGVIPQGTPANVIEFFGKTCATTKLSPFKRQIHLLKRRQKQGDQYVDRYSIQTGIDGYRATADRTGRYAGSDDYKFDEGLTEFQMIQAKRTPPTTCTVTVYKMIGGQRCPFQATARYEEYCPPDAQAFMWKKMPFLMLGKCAEALALRKAFPDELGGIYTDEEMAQAGGVAPVVEVPVEGKKDGGKSEAGKATPPDIKKCRAKFLLNISKHRDFAWLLAVEKGMIMENEPLENMSDTHIPTTKKSYDTFMDDLQKLMADWDGSFPLDKKPAYDKAYENVPAADAEVVPPDSKTPEKSAKSAEPTEDEEWRQFPMPFGKNAGVALEELDKSYLYGLWANWQPEETYNGKRKKPETIAKDKLFREMLDQAGEHYGFKIKD